MVELLACSAAVLVFAALWIAVYKLGAIAIPLFTLFGPDALEYRLGNSGARAVITDGANVEKVLQIRDRLPDLKLLFVTRGKPEAGAIDFWAALEKGSSRFEPVPTKGFVSTERLSLNRVPSSGR